MTAGTGNLGAGQHPQEGSLAESDTGRERVQLPLGSTGIGCMLHLGALRRTAPRLPVDCAGDVPRPPKPTSATHGALKSPTHTVSRGAVHAIV
jgi:hypothetical protein